MSSKNLNPCVSIIIPCFNQAPYIKEALDSVRAQTFDDWECIVVDDGSCDESANIINTIANSDSRIIYTWQENSGLSSARNLGLSMSRGKYIQFLDGDDILFPDKLYKQIEIAQRLGGAPIIISDYLFMNEAGVHYKQRICESSFLFEKPIYDIAWRWETELSIPVHAFLFHASLFRENDILFDTTLENHEDWDCWMSIFSLNPHVSILPEKLVIYRKLSNSMSSSALRNWRGFKKVINKHLLKVSDKRLVEILKCKLARTDHFYRQSWRGRLEGFLDTSVWFKRNCPWPIQKLLRNVSAPPGIPSTIFEKST